MGGGYSKFSTNIQRKNYYTDRYPILVDQRGKLVDGSHRFACALAKHVDRVLIRFLNKKVEVTSYGRDWFENQEFHDEFLRELDDRLRDILISSGAAYELIIWPPALQFTEEIEAFIAARYPIIAHAKKRPIANFTRFLEDVYLSDDIDHWKIQKKIVTIQGTSELPLA